MFTFITKVAKKGSLQDKIDSIKETMKNPLKIKWMNKLSDICKDLKEKSYISILHVDTYEPDNEHTLNDLSKIGLVKKVRSGGTDNYPHYKYSFKYDGKDMTAVNGSCYTVYKMNGLEFIFLPQLNRWFSIHKQLSTKNLKQKIGLHYYVKNIVLNKDLYFKYRILNFITYTLFYKWLNPYRFLHTLDSIYLSLKYPFLYPRNRFTGLHYTDWKLNDKICTLRKESHKGYYVKFIKDNVENRFEVFPLINQSEYNDTIKYKVISHNNYSLTVCEIEKKDSSRNVTYYPININGFYYVYDFDLCDWINISGYVKENDDKINENEEFSNHFYYLCTDKRKERKADILEWIHEYIIGLFYCIPTYSEFDSFPEGWRRKFGIQMMDELKKQLKKEKQLYKFRITDIKEKFGGLRFYVASASKEVYDIINKYENISYKTCIYCGKPAEYITSGWICPYCSDCISEDAKLSARKIEPEEI